MIAPRPVPTVCFALTLAAATFVGAQGTTSKPAAARPAPAADVASAGNWPQGRGPLRDGVSPETGLLASWPAGGPPKIFTATGLGAGFSSVAVTGGRIYTMGDRSSGQFVI